MPQPSLSTTVASIPLTTCIYNASGPRTGTSAALSKIAASSSGAVLAKSATIHPQKGNDLPRTWHHRDANTTPSDREEPSAASVNSEGLPNSGIAYYIDPQTVEESVGKVVGGKPYMVSVSGCTLEDNLTMLGQIYESAVAAAAAGSGGGAPAVSAVELNLACPNVIGKPIIAYDFEQMETVLAAVSALPMFAADSAVRIPLGVKLPPYFDEPHFVRAAEILNRYVGTVRYVASINTIGNALVIDVDAEMPAVRSNGGYAGLSGKAVKYTALANVRKMRERLVEGIDVVGVGGVSTGTDAFEMILAGANAVQVGTCHWTEGPKCFDRICDELRDIMKSKGYNSVDDFKGKLKEWSKEGVMVSRAAKRLKKDASKSAVGKGNVLVSGGGMDLSHIMNTVMVIMIAVLLADKFGHISF